MVLSIVSLGNLFLFKLNGIVLIIVIKTKISEKHNAKLKFRHLRQLSYHSNYSYNYPGIIMINITNLRN